MHKGRSHGHKTWLELNYMQFRILILLDYTYSLSTKSIVHGIIQLTRLACRIINVIIIIM